MVVLQASTVNRQLDLKRILPTVKFLPKSFQKSHSEKVYVDTNFHASILQDTVFHSPMHSFIQTNIQGIL